MRETRELPGEPPPCENGRLPIPGCHVDPYQRGKETQVERLSTRLPLTFVTLPWTNHIVQKAYIFNVTGLANVASFYSVLYTSTML